MKNVGHIVVCGLDGVGLRTVELLHHAGVRVVVVDSDADPRLLKVVAGWDVPVIAGIPRQSATLAEAGLDGAAAVICVLADDLHTLEAALLVREQRADVRIVVQLRNPAVGRALAAIDIAVLDVAGLSASSVVEACLGSGAHEFDVAGVPFVATRTVAAADGTLRSLYGDLAPLAVLPGDGGEPVLCPGRDVRVRAGDAVTVLGTPAELDAAGLTPPPIVRPARTERRLTHFAASLIDAADRRLAYVLGALMVLATVAITVLRLGYRDGDRMTVLDAMYFTAETIVTVGYGDFSFREQPGWLRLFAVGLMIVGALLATLFFALLTNALVTIRIEEALGSRRLRRMAGHVVVIGLGTIGLRVVDRLAAAGTEVVVIDSNEHNRYQAQARAMGVPVIFADATLPQTLQRVHLRDARSVAVLTSDDLVNLETALAVRDNLPAAVPLVLRLFDQQLAGTVERNFGLGLVRSTAALAAPWFVGAALGLDIVATFYVGAQLMLVGRLTVAPGGGLDGLTMQDLSARTRVVGISRAAGGILEHPPRRDSRFGAHDQAYLIGPYEELLQVLRRDTLSPLDVLGVTGVPARRSAKVEAREGE